MKTLFEHGTDFVKAHMDGGVGSVTGDYGRGIEAREGIKAIPRQVGYVNQEITEAVMVNAEDMDFVFSAADLILNFEFITPAAGDWWRFIRPDGLVAYYDVLPDASGRCYEKSDHLGTLLRVHMKLSKIETQPEPA